MPKEKHTIVIGAGVIGTCVAYCLAKRGARVTILEKDEIGKGASYGNAGAIALGHTPLNKPGRVKQAFKSIFDPLSPLYVKPRPDPDLIRWFWTFRKYCGEERLQTAMKLLGTLGHATGELFDQMIDEEKLDCNYTRGGYYEVFKTEAVTIELSDVPGSGGVTIEVRPPAVPMTLKLVMNSAGIELSNGSSSVKLTPIKVSLNNGALEVI